MESLNEHVSHGVGVSPDDIELFVRETIGFGAEEFAAAGKWDHVITRSNAERFS